MTNLEVPVESLSAEDPSESGWIELADTKLLIIVGVTGVGKSTTVNALKAGGLSFTLLPNRRELTDRFMIRQLQKQAGEAVEPVTDRAARFDYTRRYREQHWGGMGHVISQLSIEPSALTADWLVFDGLRGENEVMVAAKSLPNARFLLLDAPDSVRIQRLLKRNDVFDQIQSTGVGAADLGDTSNFLNDEELAQLVSLVQQGQVTLDELKGKLEIVRKERENYSPARTKMALFHDARDRTVYIDTVTKSAAEAAAETIDQRLS